MTPATLRLRCVDQVDHLDHLDQVILHKPQRTTEYHNTVVIFCEESILNITWSKWSNWYFVQCLCGSKWTRYLKRTWSMDRVSWSKWSNCHKQYMPKWRMSETLHACV